MTAANTTFSVFSFITFILVIIPFPWHLEAWNTGTLMYMTWTSITLLALFINSIIWSDNAINWAPVWCDISSKLYIGISVAIPAASLCINRRLYCIASVRSVTRTRADKRRAILIDLAIGVGIPVLVMILHYVVQGHRFDILQEIGCFPYTYYTWPTFPIILLPPLLLAMVSAVYCVLSILQFRKRRQEFKEILSSNSNLNSNRYFRLMALAATDASLSIPMNIVIIVLTIVNTGPLNPYNWEDVHYGFSRVDLYPAVYWQANPQSHATIEATRWSVVICGLLFFAFFGFGDEAQRHYKLAYTSVVKKMGVSTSQGTSGTFTGLQSGSSFGNKLKGITSFNISGLRSTGSGHEGSRKQSPIYISQEVVEKRDSIDSFRSELTEIKTDYSPSERGISPYPASHHIMEEDTPAGLAPPRVRKASVPSSVTPSGSFLDLNDTTFNYNRV